VRYTFPGNTLLVILKARLETVMYIKLNVLFCLWIAICAATIMAPQAVRADNTASVLVTATIDSSATLTIENSVGPTSTVSFSGYGNESVAANEGAITVVARVSTTQGNADTILQVRATNLIGQTVGDMIPVSSISYARTEDSGGATWFDGVLNNNWTTLAEFTKGSGLYSCSQVYSMDVPASANDDTYTCTISYQVTGF
jgi:hypothetical protein